MGYVRKHGSSLGAIAGGGLGFLAGGPIGAAIGAGLGGGLGSGGPSTPDAPDYLAAARATSAGNHTSQITPYGSLIYTQNKDNPDQWTATQTLSPNQQALQDQSDWLGRAAFKPQVSLMGQMTDQYGKGFQGGSDSARQQTIDSQYGYQISRLDPQWTQRENALDAKLANQGIAPGSEAWNNEMREFSNERNDAYSQARNSAIQLGNNEFQNSFQRDLTKYQLPLNMYNSLRSGSQVTNPNYVNTPGGTDALGAAGLQNQYNMGIYNAQTAAQNSLMNGLFGLGSAAMMMSDRRLKSNGDYIGALPGSYAMMMSDRRLKSNIKYVGKYKGHNFYNYDIGGRNEFGVMAQEVAVTNPDAVLVHPSGYLMVNYGAL